MINYVCTYVVKEYYYYSTSTPFCQLDIFEQ